MRLLNLIGRTFGRLTVVERAGSVGDKVCWLCRCDCGNSTKATSNNLKRGFVTSCGCYRREFTRGNQLPEGESGLNTLFYDYSRRATDKGLSFALTKEEFRALTKGDCFYCGTKPAQLGYPNHLIKIPYVYNGVDRLDSSGGYSLENCVSCCSRCNYMKSDYSVTDFISTCVAVAKHQKGLGLETSPSNV